MEDGRLPFDPGSHHTFDEKTCYSLWELGASTSQTTSSQVTNKKFAPIFFGRTSPGLFKTIGLSFLFKFRLVSLSAGRQAEKLEQAKTSHKLFVKNLMRV
jgi:hypothetical protein